MKKSRPFLAVLIVSLSYVLSPVTAKAALWDVPVAPGETFRWVFVTSLTIDAHSPDIYTYNTLVNTAASLGTSVTGVLGKSNIAEIEWWAIASTQDRDAIDNIGLSTAPIYTPLGDLVAVDKADMFDGDILHNINVSEYGISPPPSSFPSSVWTGSSTEGLGVFLTSSFFLGGTSSDPLDMLGSVCGSTLSTSGGWMFDGILHRDTSLHVFAISEELTVVPVPAALILGATGLLSSTLGLIRLRRKHQE